MSRSQPGIDANDGALLAEVRSVWQAAIAADDRSRAVFRTQRLLRRIPRSHSRRAARAVRGARSVVAGVVFAILASSAWAASRHAIAERANRRAGDGVQLVPVAPVARRMELDEPSSGPLLEIDDAVPLPTPERERTIAPVTRPTIPRPNEPGPKTEFARALASLARGDRQGAEQSFRIVADSRRAPVQLRHRALFRWAELNLVHGDRKGARSELGKLTQEADLALAADATFLLARSAPSPREPVALWRAYLARRPKTPYREDAILEEASALIEAGERGDAEDALTPLLTEALSAAQGERLSALQARIWEESPARGPGHGADETP